MDGADLPDEELVEEIVALGNGRELSLLRPPDAQMLLTEEALEDEVLMPYWAELWPSGVALAEQIAPLALKGARVLELGCGMGTAGIAAALAGGRVLAVDWSTEAIALTRRNAERNGATVETREVNWKHPEELVAQAPWDLVLASDVLYEKHNTPTLLDLLPRLQSDIWLADPGRPPLAPFLERATAAFHIEQRGDVYRLTPRINGA